jgi:alpha-L-rhamnosidase
MAGRYLEELIMENDGKLATGFLGAKPLLPALSITGNTKLAYDLFLSTEYPSWGFEVVNGATTIWERWNSYTHENGFGGEQNAQMNSFNHYAFGAVCEWMFNNAAGINSTSPAYRSIIIKPEPDPRLKHLRAEYNSISGKIVSAWRFEEDGMSMEVGIPVNVTAKIFIPAESENSVSEGGKKLSEVEALSILKSEDGYIVVEAGSGDYNFRIQ